MVNAVLLYRAFPSKKAISDVHCASNAHDGRAVKLLLQHGIFLADFAQSAKLVYLGICIRVARRR